MKDSPLIWRGFLHPEFKTGELMEIVKIEMNLKAVNKSIALFNCEKKVSGVIHSNSTGETTVILDGGYVLGKFDCPHCAVEAISLLTVKVSDGEQAGFGNYRSYKIDYSEKFYQTIHKENAHRSGRALSGPTDQSEPDLTTRYIGVLFRQLHSTRIEDKTMSGTIPVFLVRKAKKS